MGVQSKILPIPLTSISSADVSSSYAAINATGIPHPIVILRLINNSDEDVTVSYDGVNDADYIPKGQNLQLNFESNAQVLKNIANLAQGTVVYVKGSSGTGSIYLAGWYQPQGG